jgi:hypothetical protein
MADSSTQTRAIFVITHAELVLARSLLSVPRALQPKRFSRATHAATHLVKHAATTPTRVASHALMAST